MRYVDEIFVNGITGKEVERRLERLNTFDNNISFTMERPKEEAVFPSIDKKIRIVTVIGTTIV